MRRRWLWRCGVIGCNRPLPRRSPAICTSCRWSLDREIARGAVMPAD